jgi:hypothetical protein
LRLRNSATLSLLLRAQSSIRSTPLDGDLSVPGPPRRSSGLVVQPDQEDGDLGPQSGNVALHQHDVAERRRAIQASVVDPGALEALTEAKAEPVRPRVPVGEVEALRGAAADGEDGQVIPEALGRLGAAKPERVLGG